MRSGHGAGEASMVHDDWIQGVGYNHEHGCDGGSELWRIASAGTWNMERYAGWVLIGKCGSVENVVDCTNLAVE